MFKFNPKQQELLDWYGWFLSANILLFWLISLSYLPSIGWIFELDPKIISFPDKIASLGYLSIAYLGHLALLAVLPGILMIFLILFFNNRYFIISSSILMAILNACLLLGDTVVYSLFHYHLNGVILELVFNALRTGQSFFNLSNFELKLGAWAVFCFLVLEIGLAAGILKWLKLKPKRSASNLRLCFGALIILCLGISYGTYIPYAKALYREGKEGNFDFCYAMIETSRILPLFNTWVAACLPVKNGQITLEQLSQGKFAQPDQASLPLNYPLKTLEFTHKKNPLNLVVIVIDAWRFDMLTKEVTPVLYQFSKASTTFTQHFSGGNSTGPGIHSLFYSIPQTYWTALKEQKRSPVFIDELLRQQYQMHIASSAGLLLPDFNHTVFQSIQTGKEEILGETPHERDRNVTRSFKTFLKSLTQDPKPFFSFLFFDSAHSYCEINNNFEPFMPAIAECNRYRVVNRGDPKPYLNRYKNAVHLVDKEIHQVLNALKSHHLMDKTVVMITGDHGEEFNDTKKGYFGHSGNFTHYQVQTPLIVYWPGEASKTITHTTSHFDVVPTLMEKLLGCQTPTHFYSIGKSLYEHKKTIPYQIVGSYIGFGVIEHDQITSVYPTGGFEVMDLNGQPLRKAHLRAPVMQAVFEELRRFFHKPIDSH